MDVRIHNNIFDDVAFAFEGVLRLALGSRDVGSDLRLVGAPHRCYIILSGFQICEEELFYSASSVQRLIWSNGCGYRNCGSFSVNGDGLPREGSRMKQAMKHFPASVLGKGQSSIERYVAISMIDIILDLSLTSTMQVKAPKTTQEKTQDFFKTVEAGDISLFQIFEEALAIFGFTKVGKTSSCHILANSPLKAELINGDLIYKPATQKFNTATIGFTPESETEIPNIFETKFKDNKGVIKSIVLLDQPGYGDTYGFHRIFSNGYFHYRTFSKTPKLKFMLAFKKVDLEGTAEKFKSTIDYFINTFARYDEIKQDILAATSFLVTQADPKSTIDNIKKTIQKLRDESVGSMDELTKTRFQEMLNNMLTNNKIYVIERPEQVSSQTKECDILKQAYEKTTFWKRDIKSNNIVDMKQINFSVASEILNGLFAFKGKALFREDFNHFMGFMQERIDKILLNHAYSLKNIVRILEEDAVSKVEAHSFLEGMRKFVDTFYKFNEQYRIKREKTETNLFNLSDLNESGDSVKPGIGMLNNESVNLEREQRENEMRQVYFIKKFKVLEFIKERSDKIVFDEVKGERSVEWLESMSVFFIEMFRRFNYLRIQKSDSERIIYKYSYIIQRLIEESKILTLILFSNPEARVKFDEYKQGMVDILRPLNDKLLSPFGDISIPDLKQKFISRLNFDNFEFVNKDIITFFESIPYLDDKIQLKIAKLIVKYADIISVKHRSVKEGEKKFVAYKLFEYRNKFYDFLKNIIYEGSKAEKESSIENIFTLTNSLGHLLPGFHLYEEAREVFKSTNNADMVFKIFETELKVKENDAKASRLLLIQYGRYAGYCRRNELAMMCLQSAYAKSKTYGEFMEVRVEIINLNQVKKVDEPDPYVQKFYNEEFCSEFSESLKARIGLLYEEEKVITPY